MSPNGGGPPERRVRARVQRIAVVVVAAAMVLSAGAPIATAQTQTGGADAQADDGTDEEWTTAPAPLALNSSDENGVADEAAGNDEAAGTDGLSNDTREAVESAVDETVVRLQRQGVSINQSQRDAAINGTVAAVEQHQNATVEQVQNASAGAVAGTFLQSGNVSAEQVQYATAGATHGALSQRQSVVATQLQHAAHGAAHGAVAQRQNATVRQVQIVAQGAAAGAAHEAGKHESADPGAVREAAQGGAFGALVPRNGAVEQRQSVTIEQRQTAAVGAAEGALSQYQNASVKQIQIAAIGAAEGALTVEQRQEVRVEQTQAAARGACRGALEQTQRVTVTQIQQAATGAAKGAVSQSQTASVTQIQAAATGGASGVVRQVQSVTIVQIQEAAAGAARGAARSAAQNQVVNVRQIQAAAAGAGQGTVVQIQQINIVQIQIIAASAADGALSQHQTASVTQIQSAAQGACEGAVSVTQQQEVTIEQLQVVTQRAASDTAATAARIDVDNSVTIINYARGVAEDPEADVDEPDADAADELQSLFASAEDDAVFLANPNDVAVTVTLTEQAGSVETITLAPGESVSRDLAAGTYTLTAETGDGEDVELAGRDELTVSVGDAVQSLETTVDGEILAVDNPNDERVVVDVQQDGNVVETIVAPSDYEVLRILEPGNYTLTAETDGGESVPIDGGEAAQISIGDGDDGVEPEPIDLDAAVENGTLTVENPAETAVEATVTGEDGDEQTFDVPAGEAATESVEAGNYTLSAAAEDNRTVQIEGQSEFEFEVDADEAPAPAPTANLTVEDQDGNGSVLNVTNATATEPFEIEAEANDTTGTSAEYGANESAENVSIPLEPPLENDSDVTVSVVGAETGESFVNETIEYDVTEPEPVPPNATLAVENQTGNGSALNVTGANATVDYYVAAEYDGESVRTENLSAGDSVANLTLPLDPPIENDTTVDVSVRAAADDAVLTNETVAYEVDDGAEDGAQPNASITFDDQNATDGDVLVASATLPEGGFVAIHANSTNGTDDVLGASEYLQAGEQLNVTVPLEEPLDETTALNATVHRDTDGDQAFDYSASDGEVDAPYENATGAPVSDEATVSVEAAPEPEPDAVLNVTDQSGNGSVLNVTSANASVGFVVEAEANGSAATSDEFAPGEGAENLTLDLEPPLENDSDVTVSVLDAANDTELANETVEYDVTEDEVAPGPAGNLTVEDQAGNGSELVVANASASVDYVVEAEADGSTATSDQFDAGEGAENLTLDLEPPLENDSAVNVSLVDAANDTELANESVEYNVTTEEVEPAPTANLTVEDQVGNGSVLNVTSANASVDYVVEAAANGSVATSDELPAGEGVENLTLALEPALENDSAVTVSVVDAANDTDLTNESVEYDVTAEEVEPAPTANLTVEDQSGNGSVLNVTNATASVEYYVAAEYDDETVRSENLSAGESAENLTLALDPSIENDTSVDVSVRAAADDAELANETVEYEVAAAEAAPTASVTAENQTANYTHVTVASANLSEGGFVAIHANSTNGTDDVLGASAYLEPGEYEALSIELDEPIYRNATVNATVYRDADGDEAFGPATDAETGDVPYLNETGAPVSDEAYVTVPNASVAFANQTSNGSAAVVQSANLSEGGFLTLRDAPPGAADGAESVLGTSASLEAGEHENVTVPLSENLTENATLYAVAHRDTDGDEQADFVATDGEVDQPYLNWSGEAVNDSAAVTVEQRPEAGVAFENCTAARVTGAYDRVTVTLAYYDEDGLQTAERVVTGDDVTGERPVDGETLFTVGEAPTEQVTDDGVRVVTLQDPGTFGDDARSYVASVNASESPTGDQPLSATQPDVEACEDAVRPEAPSLSVQSATALDGETALVTFETSNPNTAALDPAESLFTAGTTVDQPPDSIVPGGQAVTVEWTPVSTDEQLVWTANLSNFGLDNATAETQPAGEIEGLLEAPEEPVTEAEGTETAEEETEPIGPDAEPGDEPADEETDTPTEITIGEPAANESGAENGPA
ncbi:DUF7282 domain-containing protein [Halomicrobium salinisoli]|uniref:DUF7282 domain-containing protein n=1 Tax=Halomicrobium salinisoli TaxID=2878391 RepID=UPI001CF02214|nr:hypothetical protein [Halomicrobium salinisoli]